MIEMVHKYPGQVVIYAAGPLTNIALAVLLNETFAQNVKSIVIQGGYLDVNLLQVDVDMGLFSDFNILFDPEAASIVFEAPFPSFTVVGEVSSYMTVDEKYLDDIAEVETPFTTLMRQYYGMHPLWDESAAAIQAHPEIVTQSIVAHMDVNTAYNGPSYGKCHIWPASYAPYYTRPVTIIRAMNKEALYTIVKSAVQRSY